MSSYRFDDPDRMRLRPPPPWTRAQALRTPIAALGRCWLLLRCAEHGTVLRPVPMLARVWPDLTLGQCVERSRCRQCRRAPSIVMLTAEPVDVAATPALIPWVLRLV